MCLGDNDMNGNFGLSEKVKNDISDYAKRYGVEKVILFGSRARGTNSERSDIDLAVKGGNVDEFRFAMDELVRTLLMFDVADLSDNPSRELLSEIERDGVVIYEKV